MSSIALPPSPLSASTAPRLSLPALGRVWVLALWMATVGNWPLWVDVLSLDQPLAQRSGLALVLCLMVAGGTAALLFLLYWPRLFRPLASMLALVTAFNSHFMWQFSAVIDSTMLASVIHTDVHEVRDLMSWWLVASGVLIAGPALWWIWRKPMVQRSALTHVWRNALGVLVGLGLVVCAALAGYQGLSSLMRNQKEVRFMISPLNSVYAAGVLVAQQVPSQVQPLKPVGEDARLGASYAAQKRSPLFVLVVGETARAKNWQLNGYERPTTPKLAQWQSQGNLVNFSHVTACGSSTQVSVPCMFSALTREEGGHQPPNAENLLDVLQRAGLAVLWIDNQSGCKGVCDRVAQIATRVPAAPEWCSDGECNDLALLHDIDARIEALDPVRRARGVVVVLHQMGSHGPAYFKRKTREAKPFLPECESAALKDCSAEQLMNAYDNTLAQTDTLLDTTLQWLRARTADGRNDTGMIYVSDHGESLGENGLYLHGVPYAFAPDEQLHVPMVAWLSPELQTRNATPMVCVGGQADQRLSHDNLFHTVLGLMDVQTKVYEPALDAFATCRTAPLFKPPQAG